MISLALLCTALASKCDPIGASKMQRSLAMTRRGASAGLLSVAAVAMLPVDESFAAGGASPAAVTESGTETRVKPPKFVPFKWSGAYLDALHPRGSYNISQKGTKLTITGRNEPRDKKWTIHGEAIGSVAVIDFRPMGGRAEESATLKANSCITFSNGYNWSKKKQ